MIDGSSAQVSSHGLDSPLLPAHRFTRSAGDGPTEPWHFSFLNYFLSLHIGGNWRDMLEEWNQFEESRHCKPVRIAYELNVLVSSY